MDLGKKTWTQFKYLIDNSRLQWEFVEEDNSYHLRGIQGTLMYTCIIIKDNGSDQIDFETNYKSSPSSNISLNKYLEDALRINPATGEKQLEIVGTMAVTTPPAPPATTPITISADDPINVSGSTSPAITDFVIPDTKTFTVTQVVAGAEGDSNDKGSKVELYYVDSSSVEHLISRLYLIGDSRESFPNTAITRDNTEMIGDGVNTKIRIKRIRLGNASLEIDALIRGYIK